MDTKFYTDQLVFGIEYINSKPFEPHLIDGYFFKEIFQNGERIIVLKKEKNTKVYSKLQNKRILNTPSNYDLILTTRELSNKYNKKKYKELKKLINYSISSKTSLPHTAYKSFFEGNDILSKIKPNKQTKIYYFSRRVINRIKFLFSILFCDLITAHDYQRRISKLETEQYTE